MEPVYTKLAQLLKEKGEDSIVLTKLNMDKNDIPLRHIKVTHFPALWVWPAGDKSNPVDFGDYNHAKQDGDSGHSHFELGMMEDFIRHKDHHVREAHHDGAWDAHLHDA